MSKLKISRRMITLIVGIGCAVIAVVVALSLMLGSYGSWKGYYNTLIEEREHQKYLDSLPLEFTGISAALADGVVFYDNGTADPEAYDFTVSANFTEKGREFSRKLSLGDYSIEVPDDFADHGGAVTVSYTWQPEKAEDAAEDDPLPDPITKTTQVNISLVAPDETVYKVTAMPTFFEPGEAENMNGDKVTLPLLNDTNYTYTEYVTEGFARFDYAEPKITIKKPLVAELAYKLVGADAEIEVNNVNCHFAVDMPNASLSYDDDSSAFVITSDAENTVEFASLKSDNLTIAGTGTVRISGTTLKTGALTVKSGATLVVQDCGSAIDATSLMFEAGSDVTCLTSANGIMLRGNAKLFGALTVRDQNGDTDMTGMEVVANDVSIELAETSSVTFESFTFGIGRFGSYTNPTVLLPYGTEQTDSGSLEAGEKASWYVTGEDEQTHKILVMKNITAGSFCNASEKVMDYESMYTVVKAPTATEEGLATAEGMDDVILPVLGKENYTFAEEANNVVAFTHNDTKLVIRVPVEGERITIGGVTYNALTIATHLDIAVLSGSYADGAYTLTVADGETAALGAVSTSGGVTITGDGTVNVSGEITADVLTVRSGTALNVTNEGKAVTANGILFEEGSNVALLTAEDSIVLRGNAQLFGTLLIKDKDGDTDKTAVNIQVDGVTIELARSSRITIDSFTYAFGQFNGELRNAQVLMPYGTFAKSSGDLGEGERAGWFIVDGSGRQDIMTLKNITAAATMEVAIVMPSLEGVTVEQQPTPTTTGKATTEDGSTIVLPVLSAKNYAFEEKTDNVVTFTHYETAISFDVTVEGERLTVDGTVYNPITASTHLADGDMAVSYADGVYTFTVAEGKTAEFGKISGKALVLDGKGTLSLAAASNVLVVDELTVNAGILNIEASASAMVLDNMTIAEGAAVNVTAPTAPTDNMIALNNRIVIDGTLTCVNASDVNKVTAIYATNTNGKMDITVGRNGHVLIRNFEVTFGIFSQGVPKGMIHLPAGTVAAEIEKDDSGALNNWGYYIDDGGEKDWLLRYESTSWTWYSNVDTDIAAE